MADTKTVELQVYAMQKDRADFITKKRFVGMTLPAFIEEMRKTYTYLHDSSKSLFDKIMAGELDDPKNMDLFKHMMMIRKTTANMAQKDADMIYGQQMFKKYVEPLVKDKENNG